MDDYISREDALDVFGDIHPLDYNTQCYADRIKDIPAADVVEVVRCRECELWNDWDHSGHKELGNFVCSCAHWSNEDGYPVVYTAPDDYCSYGEPKE